MQLVEAPICNVDKYEVPPYTIDAMQDQPIFFIGRKNYHNIFIQLEEGDEVTFGQVRYHPLQIANYRFYGLIPYRWESRTDKIVECVVDRFEII